MASTVSLHGCVIVDNGADLLTIGAILSVYIPLHSGNEESGTVGGKELKLAGDRVVYMYLAVAWFNVQ